MKKTNHIVRSALALSLSFLLCLPSHLAYAENVKDLENKTSDLKNELSDLNSELDALSKDLDETIAEIEEKSAEMEETKTALAEAEAEEEKQYEAMKKRIKYMYEEGDTSFLEMLFDSHSIADFLNNADFITSVTEYDRYMLEQLAALSQDIKEKKEKLEEEQASLKDLQKSLSDKEKTLKDKISTTSSDLANFSDQLAKAKAAEKAAQEALNKKPEKPAQKPSDDKNSGSKPDTKPDDGNSGGSSQKPSHPASGNDVTLLAALIQCEAGTKYNNVLAVGTVVMNRVRSSSYPNSISGVIYQSGQFPPAYSSKFKRLVANGPNSTCMRAAQDVINGKVHPKVANCYSFRSAATSNHPGVIIGGNVFW